MKLNFEDEVHLYANFFFLILTIYRKSFLFRFLSRGKRVQIPILIRARNEHITSRKNSQSLLKNVRFET